MNLFRCIVFILLFSASIFGSFIIFLNIDARYIEIPLKSMVSSNQRFYIGLDGKYNYTAVNYLVLSNSIGSQSPMYRGEKKISAFFGGCSFVSDTGVDITEQVSQKLSHFIGDSMIYNFSDKLMYCRVILEKLKRMNRKFDSIFLSSMCISNKEWETEPSKRVEFKTPTNFKKLAHLFVKQIQSKIENTSLKLSSNPDSENIYTQIDIRNKYEYDGPPKPLPKFDITKSIVRRLYRNGGKIKLVYQPPGYSIYEKMEKIRFAKEMFREALAHSNKVYFITQPMAFDENQSIEVAKKSTALRPSKKNKKADPSEMTPNDSYLDDLSLALFFRENNELMALAASELGIKVIDLDSFFRNRIKNRDDVFYDHFHLTPRGALLAARYIYSQMESKNFGTVSTNENSTIHHRKAN